RLPHVACAGTGLDRPAGGASPRIAPAGLGGRADAGGHRGLFRQPLSAQRRRPALAGHGHAAGRAGLHGRLVADGAGAVPAPPMNILHVLRREFGRALPPTLFFLISFHIGVLIRHLDEEGYGITPGRSMMATISALVLGKLYLL